MTAANGTSKRTEANFAFSAFVLALFGWALVETQLIASAAGIKAHLLASALGLAISAIALRRCRRCWRTMLRGADAAVSRPVRNRDHIGNFISCVALAVAGCVFAVLERGGSISLFLGYAGAFSLVPWSRLRFCRRHFLISFAILVAGAASVIVIRGTAEPILNLFYAWVLWSIALSELLVTSNGDRTVGSRPEPSAPVEPQLSARTRDTLPELEDQPR